ncbi:MAG: hypothetical protein KC486_10840, partial [Myxococcales bacterium]|nr:hypothetical protein [Myxococcales bacterium]
MRALVPAALSLALACGADVDQLGAVASVDPRSRCYPVIEFGDPRLEAQIRERIDLPAGPLSVLEVEALWWWESSLDSSEQWDIDGADLYGIRDLEGIQCLPFTGISCADCPVRDLGPLAGMPALEVLRISGARALSLDPLAELMELREVTLIGGSLIDADALLGEDAVFPWLRHLNLTGNLISDSVGTPKLPALERLYLGDNALRAAPDVSRMPSLTHLKLDDNPVRDLGPLAGHAKLRELSVEDAAITSIEPLVDVPLETLRLAGNAITDAGTVPTSVRELDLRRNRLRALTWPTLPALWRLDLDDNPLVSLEGLRAPALEELRASGCALTSTAGVEVVEQPEFIDLHANQITRPTGIRGDSGLDIDLR